MRMNYAGKIMDQPISGEGALSAKADDCAGDNDSADCGMSDRAGDDGGLHR